MIRTVASRRHLLSSLPLTLLLASSLAPATGAQDAASPVAVGTAELRTVEEHVTLNGTVISPRFADLSPTVGGLVQEIHKTFEDIRF